MSGCTASAVCHLQVVSDGNTLYEQCNLLLRDSSARGVLVTSDDGGILGHAGAIAALPEATIDTVADLIADCVAARSRGELREGDDLVTTGKELSACVAPLGKSAALAVIFDARSTVAQVRQRMRVACALILQSLSDEAY